MSQERIEFNEDDVLQLLLKLNVSLCKSTEPDNVYHRVLKECAKELLLPLNVLFPVIFEVWIVT